jgi:polysaccharide deacetylase family protein (PEP-CTERM system associated)
MSSTVAATPITNVLSFDVEDWYQGIEQPAATWDRFTPRIERGIDVILELLAAREVRATFFVLGYIAVRHPDVVRRIAAAGHEIGSHGHQHDKVYDLDPERFRDDIRRSTRAIEDAVAQRVLGYRAPYFSITRSSEWALDVLADEGLRYDASIYPGANYRYGIPGYRQDIHQLPNGLIECPVSMMTLCGRRLGIGGAYLRILPVATTAGAIRDLNTRGLPAGVYLHPWEFDPGHPRVRFRWRAMLTHYANLRSTAPKLRRLLEEFRWGSFDQILGLRNGEEQRRAGPQ